MLTPDRDILVLLKTDYLTESAIEQEVELLNALLKKAESTHSFCIAHELVDRNYIHSKHSRILRESRRGRLRPFRFLLNKN